MTIQKQQETMLASEQETSSNDAQWHAPVLNVYNAEDAEAHPSGTPGDSSIFFS